MSDWSLDYMGRSIIFVIGLNWSSDHVGRRITLAVSTDVVVVNVIVNVVVIVFIVLVQYHIVSLLELSKMLSTRRITPATSPCYI